MYWWLKRKWKLIKTATEREYEMAEEVVAC